MIICCPSEEKERLTNSRIHSSGSLTDPVSPLWEEEEEEEEEEALDGLKVMVLKLERIPVC